MNQIDNNREKFELCCSYFIGINLSPICVFKVPLEPAKVKSID